MTRFDEDLPTGPATDSELRVWRQMQRDYERGQWLVRFVFRLLCAFGAMATAGIAIMSLLGKLPWGKP